MEEKIIVLALNKSRSIMNSARYIIPEDKKNENNKNENEKNENEKTENDNENTF